MKEFLRKSFKTIGSARLIIIAFFILLIIATYVMRLSPAAALSNVMTRWCMNFVLVLAMVPAVNSGVGLNFASPLGITCGLLGSVLAIEFGFTGAMCMVMAIVISIPFALLIGYLYGRVLNTIKGSEMMIATYTGFAFISLMSIVWLFLPVKNTTLTMPMGNGLRMNIDLSETFGYILDNFLKINIAGVDVPLGFILVCLAMCFVVKVFMNSRTGIMMLVAGENTSFSRSIGINVDSYRILGIVLSTVLSAVGIIFYSQSYGFLQMYQAPLMMAFSAVAAILIGGATMKNAQLSHVIIGTLLYNGILSLSMPVANALAPQSNIAELVRIIASNGVIIYALSKIKREA